MSEKDKINRLVSVPDEFLSKIPRAESQIYDAVVELLSRLEVRGGAFAITAKNLQIAQEISELLRTVLLSSDYAKYVAEFAREFDQQAAVSDKVFKTAFPDFKRTQLASNVIDIAKREAIDLLLNRASDTDFVAPLRDVIQQSVINGAGFKETLTSIRTFIEGNEEELGALRRYSSTYSRDAFAQADRSYTSVVSEELDAEWFKWSGGEIATTRPFCAERHNEFYHYKEIEAWGAGEPTGDLQWPKSGTWAGRIPETNSATIYGYAGGFNCMHSVLPQSVFAVPRDVIERNIANGNYQPSEKELQMVLG